MSGDKKIPSLSEALRETSDYVIPEKASKTKAVDPVDIPPPPGDWTSHAATRTVLFLIIIASIAVSVWKWEVWYGYFKEHPFGFGLTVFGIFAVIILISIAYWRYRTQGDLGMRYWDTERKRKPR